MPTKEKKQLDFKRKVEAAIRERGCKAFWYSDWSKKDFAQLFSDSIRFEGLWDFSHGVFTKSNFSGLSLLRTSFDEATLESATLSHCDLLGTGFYRANLSYSDLSSARLIKTCLVEAKLVGANLSKADLSMAEAGKADFTNANLTEADLSGCDLKGANLTGAIGLGTREGEIKFAKQMLRRIKKDPYCLNMLRHHTSDNEHSLAGWMYPKLKDPEPKASRMLPTLAGVFYRDSKFVTQTLYRVAAGELSVFPN